MPSDRYLPVCTVPVRMLEAWLLIDEAGLRRAAGNPNGRVVLDLPPLGELEKCADPKGLLYQLLKEASELRGRRLGNLNVRQCACQATDYIDYFSSLRVLSAFQCLETDIEEMIATNHWGEHAGSS